MFELFPFPGTIIYGPASPVTRSASDSEPQTQDITQDIAQEDYRCASSMTPCMLTDTSKLLGFLDEKGSESLLPIQRFNGAFSSSTESEPTSTASRITHEQVETLRMRKGHKKSRNGCYNCKKRKIKVTHVYAVYVHKLTPFQCPENRPACHNCVKVLLDCKYPSLHVIRAVRSPPLDLDNLQSTPTVFDSTDMRLFHHFLMNSYPHLPLGNDNVWSREIASFAHSVSYANALHCEISC